MYKIISLDVRTDDFEASLEEFTAQAKSYIENGYIPLGPIQITPQPSNDDWVFVTQTLWFDPIKYPEKLL